MAFTVVHEGGMKQRAFEAYLRLLARWGGNVANTARTMDPVTRQRWLPVWLDDKKAERFAEELRTETDDCGWQVREVPEPAVSQGPLGPIEIYIGPQSESVAFGLHPNSQTLVRQRFPEANQIQSVVIGADPRRIFGDAQTAMLDQVAQLLTGLSEAQVRELGGYRIYDPVEEKVVRESRCLTG